MNRSLETVVNTCEIVSWDMFLFHTYVRLADSGIWGMVIYSWVCLNGQWNTLNRITKTQYLIISWDTQVLAYLISAFGAVVSMSIAFMVILDRRFIWHKITLVQITPSQEHEFILRILRTCKNIQCDFAVRGSSPKLNTGTFTLTVSALPRIFT